MCIFRSLTFNEKNFKNPKKKLKNWLIKNFTFYSENFKNNYSIRNLFFRNHVFINTRCVTIVTFILNGISSMQWITDNKVLVAIKMYIALHSQKNERSYYIFLIKHVLLNYELDIFFYGIYIFINCFPASRKSNCILLIISPFSRTSK